MNGVRSEHTASVLRDGKVLVVGGMKSSSSSGTLKSTELYDPSANSWTPASDLNEARSGHTASILKNGKVLVVGGKKSSSSILKSAELQ